MAKAKTGNSIDVRIVSTGTYEDGRATGYTYYVKKNPKTMTDKLSMRKYDPRAWNKDTGRPGMHVQFEEKKMPPSKKN